MRARSLPGKILGSSGAIGLPVLGLFTTLTIAATGCSNNSDTQVLPPVVLGMLDSAAPTYDDGLVKIFEVHRAVELPLRRPGARPSGNFPPYPEAPYQLAGDTNITVRFTLTNLSDEQRTVELLIDPWNEFVRYVPGVALGEEDETQPNLSGIDRFYVVPAKSRIEGIFTPDDMKELATDLGTAMSLAASPPAADSDFGGPVLYNRAFNVQNRSSEPDPVLAPYLPSVAAGVTGFDLGLRTYDGAAKVAVELMIDVEDVHGERVLMPDDDGVPIGPPGATLTPPGGLGGM